MSICVYCLKNKNIFNREHVLPRAFGTFEPINFVLTPKPKRKDVCSDCNNNFSQYELVFAKNSFEALERVSHNPQKKLTSKITNIKIKCVEGIYSGLNFYLCEDGTVSPLPQVAFKNHKNTWVYFCENELENFNKDNFNLKDNDSIRVFGDEHTILHAKSFPERLGISFDEKGELPAPSEKIITEIEFAIDKIIRKTIAKIAFNYLTYHNYKKIILRKEFNKIKNFIINKAIDDKGEIVQVIEMPILADEKNSSKRRLCHIVALYHEKTNIFAKVSIYNQITYRVLLGQLIDYNSLNLTAHIFDPMNQNIHEIKRTNLIIPSIHQADIIQPVPIKIILLK